MVDNKLAATAATPRAKGRRGKWRWVLGVGLILVISAYFVLTSSFFLKGVVLPRVGRALHAEVTATELQFSPFSQVTIKGLKITPQGAARLLAVDLIRVRYHGPALLRGHLKIDEITIESPVVTLQQLADGTSNLDPLVDASDDNTHTPPAPTDRAAKPPTVYLKQLTIKNATLQHEMHARDGGTVRRTLSGLNLTAVDIRNDGAGRLEMAARLEIENAGATGHDTLAAALSGRFDFHLAPTLWPDNLTGSTALAVEKAGGNFAEAANLSAHLDCHVTPTEVKQLALQFLKGDTRLAQLEITGPFDAANREGRLKVQLAAVDRTVLNLAGAVAGLDFGSTVLNANSDLRIENGGDRLSASGQINLDRLQIIYKNQTTPTSALRCDYDLTWNQPSRSVLLNTLDVTGTQDAQPVFQATLTRPMGLAFGSATTALDDATLQLAVTNLNLADWRAFAADLAPAGVINANARVTAEKGASALRFHLETHVSHLAAKLDDLHLAGLDVQLVTQGQVAGMAQFQIDKLQLDLARQKQPVLTASVSGNFHTDTQDADLRASAQVAVPGLLEVFPQEGAEFSAGTLTLQTRLLQKSATQTVTGQLALAGLRGRYNGHLFDAFSSAVHWDLALRDHTLEIRQARLLLDPTERARNELHLAGNMDFSTSNAITGQLELTADTLDLTPYYDLVAGSSPDTSSPPSPAPAPDLAQNVEPAPVRLPFQNFTLATTIQRLYLREIDAQNLRVTARLTPHRLALQPVEFSLNNAPISAKADLDLGIPGYQYVVTCNASNVPVAPLANTFSPHYRDHAAGLLTARMDMQGAGLTGTSLRRALNASAHFSFTNANIQIAGPKLRAIITPIALVLGAPELLDSPLNYLNADLRAAAGQIEIPDFIAHSDAFIATTRGVVPIADVLSASPLNQNLEISLASRLAKNLRLANPATNNAYVALPAFARLSGTLGNPEVKTDKTVILALTAGSLSNVLGGKAGEVLGEVSALLGGKPTAADSANMHTNAPATNPPPADPVGDLLNLFRKPKN